MATTDQDVNGKTDDESTVAAEKPKPLQVSVEDIGPGRKLLKIEVPAARIADKFDDSYKQLKTDANIPGFRKGRAPRRLIERRFSTTVRDDVKGQLVGECFAQAVDDEKLEVIGEPDVKELESIELPDEGSLQFQVEVEVAPEVELPALDGIAVDKSAIAVADTDVDHELEQLRHRLGSITAVEGGKAEESDLLATEVRILSGLNANDDAEVIDRYDDASVRVPGKSKDDRGHVVGIVVDELGKQLGGKKVGDVVRISMTGPASHENEKIKDKPITIAVTINRIDRTEPIAAESIVEQLGFDSIDMMKEYLRGMIESRASHGQREAMRKQISEYLLEHTELELPDNLTGRQTERLLHRRRLEWSSMGLPDDEVSQRVAEARSGSEDEARRQLKMFFILNQAAKKFEIEVTDAEINGVIAQLAAEQGRRPQKMRQDMQRSGELEHMGLLVRERKTLDRILEAANVTEIEAGEKPKKKSTTKKERSTKKPAAKSTKKPVAKSSKTAKATGEKSRPG